jgi:Na+-transporting NADH:ubiquinone oxidoreductase subunit NqrB|tara:strand:- start:3168 stop:3332 length:165 start_codon:yes stop_codon:yes gene_type:complete
MGNIMEIFALLFIVFLSFVFHCVVYEDDYIKKWYWKVLIGGSILALTFAAVMGY